MAETVNCRRCKQVFKSSGSPYCNQCRPIEDVIFNEVTNYLFRHPNCDITQLAEGAGVDATKILEYIRDGHIDVKHK